MTQPAQTVRRLTPAQWLQELAQQKVPTWHHAFVCPKCFAVQSAESVRREKKKLLAAEDLASHTCVYCGISVRSDGRVLTFSPAPIIVVYEFPFFAPATPEDAQTLKASWK